MAIIVITGEPGSGKTYEMACQGLEAMKQGCPVFTNFPLKGAYKLEAVELATSMFPPHSKIFISEAGSEFDSQKWERFLDAQKLFFSQHRKFGIDLYLDVQHPGFLWVYIRRLVNEWWVASPSWFWFTYEHYYQWRQGDNESSTIEYQPAGVHRRLRRRAVYEAYDTLYLHKMVDRKPMKLIPWEYAPVYRRPGWTEYLVNWLKGHKAEIEKADAEKKASEKKDAAN